MKFASMQSPIPRLIVITLAIALAAASATALTGCNGPKALTRKAHKYEAAQLHAQAADYYVMALRKKPGHIEALVGLRSTGQLVFDDQMGDFKMKSAAGDRAGAISAYEKARSSQQKYASVGVELSVPPSLSEDFDAIVNSHVTQLYDAGMAHLNTQNYEAAATQFQEVTRLSPEFRDAQALLVIARAEPLYIRGETAFNNKRYRAAHQAFTACVAVDPNYKSAALLRDEALSVGRFNIAINTFESGYSEQGAAVELRGIIMDALLNSNDPFIGVVDRLNQDQMLAEQELALSGLVESNSAVSVGEMTGARGALTGSIMAFSVETSELRKSRKKAFVQHKKVIEQEDGTKVTEISYTDAHYITYQQSRVAYLKFNITLVSLETGAILFNQVETVEASDEVSYARSQYPTNKLFPARTNGEVWTGGRHSMRQLLNSNQNLSTEAALRSDLMGRASRIASQKVEQFLSSHVE